MTSSEAKDRCPGMAWHALPGGLLDAHSQKGLEVVGAPGIDKPWQIFHRTPEGLGIVLLGWKAPTQYHQP